MRVRREVTLLKNQKTMTQIDGHQIFGMTKMSFRPPIRPLINGEGVESYVRYYMRNTSHRSVFGLYF